MKVAPVDRYGSWRPGGSDARAVSSSRLQTVTPETTPQAAQQPLSSGRELPIVPVKQGSNVQSRPVRESDRPVGLDPALNTFKEFQANSSAPTAADSTAATSTTLTTVEAFSNPSSGAQAAAAVNAAAAENAPKRQAVVDTVSASTTAGKAQLSKRDDRVAAPKSANQSVRADTGASATQTAADVARKQAAEELSKQPPKEPIAKMLMDQVQALWAASASVVEASKPVAKPGAPLQATEKIESSSKNNAAEVARTAAASNARKPAPASKPDQPSSS